MSDSYTQTAKRSPVTLPGHRAGQPAPNKGRKFPAEILTPDEVRGLIRACSNRAPTGVRNRALLVVMYRGGLRLDEALALKAGDIDARTGTLRVLHGKGDKARTVGVDPGAMAVIERWLDRRRQLGLRNREVFSTLDGRPLQPTYVRTLLARLADKLGIEKRVHPHALRHTCAAELAEAGTPVNTIQAMLGHSSLAVTDRYLRHVRPMDVVTTMRNRTWEL